VNIAEELNSLESESESVLVAVLGGNDLVDLEEPTGNGSNGSLVQVFVAG
jgi:hypothetical protein